MTERAEAALDSMGKAADDALVALTDDLASMTVRMQIAEDGRKIETRRAERALDDLSECQQEASAMRAYLAEIRP
jgi:hypothetical protein